jgi:2-C-methyl-D-erythritol 2,4-cyclodiphosphate synthase
LFRIGFGYDVHRLVEGRPLILGGVEIPHPVGLEGHSDADVLTHAVIDAIIGALGAGDIGQHFPDADPAYKGVSSLLLLKTATDLMHDKGFQLNNLDATIVAQAPRLAPYLTTMREKFSGILAAPAERINLKATTSERLGFCGKGEGMEAFAVVSLIKVSMMEKQGAHTFTNLEGVDA